jgi:hypothetical protein
MGLGGKARISARGTGAVAYGRRRPGHPADRGSNGSSGEIERLVRGRPCLNVPPELAAEAVRRELERGDFWRPMLEEEGKRRGKKKNIAVSFERLRTAVRMRRGGGERFPSLPAGKLTSWGSTFIFPRESRHEGKSGRRIIRPLDIGGGRPFGFRHAQAHGTEPSFLRSRSYTWREGLYTRINEAVTRSWNRMLSAWRAFSPGTWAQAGREPGAG